MRLNGGGIGKFFGWLIAFFSLSWLKEATDRIDKSISGYDSVISSEHALKKDLKKVKDKGERKEIESILDLLINSIESGVFNNAVIKHSFRAFIIELFFNTNKLMKNKNIKTNKEFIELNKEFSNKVVNYIEKLNMFKDFNKFITLIEEHKDESKFRKECAKSINELSKLILAKVEVYRKQKEGLEFLKKSKSKFVSNINIDSLIDYKKDAIKHCSEQHNAFKDKEVTFKDYSDFFKSLSSEFNAESSTIQLSCEIVNIFTSTQNVKKIPNAFKIVNLEARKKFKKEYHAEVLSFLNTLQTLSKLNNDIKEYFETINKMSEKILIPQKEVKEEIQKTIEETAQLENDLNTANLNTSKAEHTAAKTENTDKSPIEQATNPFAATPGASVEVK